MSTWTSIRLWRFFVRTGDWLSALPPLLGSDSCKYALLAGADAPGWGGSWPGWKKEAVGKTGGGEGEVGERGAVAGKVDWEEPCEKGRLPLCLDVNDFQEVMITVF